MRSWKPRWYELVPEIVLILGLTIFLIDEPDAATSALKSGRAWALMVLVGLSWLVVRVVTALWLPWRVPKTAVFGLAALGVLAVVVLPAYDNNTVVETLTSVAAPSVSTTTSPSGSIGAPTTTNASAPPTTVAPAGPTRLRVDRFRGIDHRASGTVAIYRQPDGRYVVGLEDFDIQPGPDYDLYVVPGANREKRDGGTRLDDLRGNRGTQFYDVPAGVDLGTGDWSVLVWCQTFGVPVANATPA
jgi:hypothetical protein